jgi:hypothetical protein
LLSFSAETFVSEFAIQKYKNQYTINYKFTCYLYWGETWYPTLRKNYGLRMFENRVLRKKLPPKRDRVIGKWRKLQNEKMQDV